MGEQEPPLRRRRALHRTGRGAPLLLLALSTLSPILSTTEASTKWKRCGPKLVPVEVEGVEMRPDPPLSGHNFTLLLPSLTKKELTGGSVLVFIYFSGFPIWRQTENLCAKAACPVEPGPVTFQHIQHLPTIAPEGQYDVRLAAVDFSGAPLFCTEVSLTVVRPTGGARSDAKKVSMAGPGMGRGRESGQNRGIQKLYATLGAAEQQGSATS